MSAIGRRDVIFFVKTCLEYQNGVSNCQSLRCQTQNYNINKLNDSKQADHKIGFTITSMVSLLSRAFYAIVENHRKRLYLIQFILLLLPTVVECTNSTRKLTTGADKIYISDLFTITSNRMFI